MKESTLNYITGALLAIVFVIGLYALINYLYPVENVTWNFDDGTTIITKRVVELPPIEMKDTDLFGTLTIDGVSYD